MKRAIFGGITAAIIIFLGSWSVGQLSNSEALDLFRSVQPTIRFMCSAIMTANATILALLLTLLSFTSAQDNKFKPGYFSHIRIIAKLSTITFIAALVLLMFLSVPLQESTAKLRVYYSIIYYAVEIYAALLGGALITIVMMLYDAADSIILVLHPKKDAKHLILQDEEELAETEKKE